MKTTPGLDNPDVEYGDVGPMRDALKIQGIGGAGAPRPALETGGHPTGAPTRNDQLPDFVTKPPSSRDGEPITAGSDMGPGPGQEALETRQPEDLRELTLSYLATAFGNSEAAQMLDEYRVSKQSAQPQASSLAPAPPAGPMSAAPTFDETDIAAPDEFPRAMRQPTAPEGELSQPTEEPPPGPVGDTEPNPVDDSQLVPEGQEGQQ